MDFGVTDYDIDRYLKVENFLSSIAKTSSLKPLKKCKFCGKIMSKYNNGKGCFTCLDRLEKEEDQRILDEMKRKAQEKEEEISPEEVVTLVSNFFDLDEKLVYKRCHKKEVNRVRQIIVSLLYNDLKLSYEYIGKVLNGRNFSTISRTEKEVRKRVKEESLFAQDLEEIRGLI